MNAVPWQASEGGWRIALHVQPRSRRPGVGGLRAGRLHVRVAPPPAEGAANAALIALLARALAVPPTAIKLTAGAGGRDKTVVVTTALHLHARLSELAREPS